MAKTVSDYLIDRLYEWGIHRIYGYPGDGINGIMGALLRAGEKMQFIQTRHEEMAAFMACAHAKFTGDIGVCMATSGPGAIHLLNGLYDARMDHQPVLAIVGQQASTALGSEYQQEVDLGTLYKDVASSFVHTVSSPVQMRHIVDRAVRISTADSTVTCIIIPNDIQEEPAVEAPPRKHGVVFSGSGYSKPRIIPKDSDLKRAADVLNAGKKVAMLIGAGAISAADEVMETAEILGAGIAKALLGKAALPDELPYVTGAIGLLGTKPSWVLMNECDSLLVVGSNFPYSEFLPKAGSARGVQIDIKARNLSARYPMEVNLHGEAKETLQALIPLLHRKEDRSWQEQVRNGVEEWWKVLEARAKNEADPINPQLLFWELSPKLPDNCIITCDSGTAANWFARDLKVRSGMLASLSGNLATMCPGVPYAIAAKFCFPDRVAVALVGDGAMQMLGNNGLITISKYWKEWDDPRLIICVLNNHDLSQVTWEQRVLAGDPKFEASQNIPDFPYAKYAQDLGLHGVRVEKPEAISGAWDEVFSADRPAVLDVRTDANVPPLPPHISFKQARMYLSSILKGDPDKAGMIKQSFKDLVESWTP
ncbi:MAG: thiamine pyrophosphate-requiring protein [Phycisphaerae bacterium]|nr:thiamine pyrophosphate-requiring protein [Phycisphaerae bacterium]